MCNMRVFLIHIRDPQFYALPAANRAKNGRIWVMGLPIGIMSLSAVLKRIGHERQREKQRRLAVRGSNYSLTH